MTKRQLKIKTPEDEYSGHRKKIAKSSKRIWYEQLIVLIVSIFLPTVGILMAIVSPDKFGWISFTGLVLTVILGYLVLGAKQELEGVTGHLTETYTPLDDYPELLLVEEHHLVSAPDNTKRIDLDSLKEIYNKQLEKMRIESKALAKVEGQILIGEVRNIDKDKAFVVMEASRYEELTDKIVKVMGDVLDMQAKLDDIKPEDFKWNNIKRLDNLISGILYDLALTTKPRSVTNKKLMEMVVKQLNVVYETYIS